MAKAQSRAGKGQGWHNQTLRHSRARSTGHAGGKYINLHANNPMQADALYGKLKRKGVDDMFLYNWGTGKNVTIKNTAKNRKIVENLQGIKKSNYYKFMQAKDSDGDGVPDKADCAPNDPHKQHTITRIKTADGTDTSDLSGEIQKALREKGYSADIVVKNASRIDVKQVRLSDEGIKTMGYNVKEAEYTKSGQRRSRVPTWEQWEDINHTINDVLDKHDTFANIQSLGGRFKIRKGTERIEEWEEQKHENVGSIMNPVERGELYTQQR